MVTTRSSTRAVRVIVAFAVVGLLATGCGRIAERALEAATGADDVTIDRDTGSVSIETDDGSMSFDVEEDSGEFRMETDDGTFTAAPTTEIPPEIAARMSFPDRFVPESVYEQTTPDGHALVVGGTIDGVLSEVLDELEGLLRNAGHDPERFIMDQGGEGMGSLHVASDDGELLQVSLIGDSNQMMLQVMLIQP